MLAKEVNMVPDELIGNLGDCHLYSNHIEQAKEQLTRTPYELPKLYFEKTEDWGGESVEFGDFHPTQIELRDYQSHNTIKAPLSN
jgi:thymidylate synthase